MEEMVLDLIVDVGNTRIKLALFHKGSLLRSVALVNGDMSGFEEFVRGQRIGTTVMASVGEANMALEARLRQLASVLVVSGSTPTPLKSLYGTPLTLGADRVANAVGAAAFVPGRPVLAIDLGTCITYDLVSADGIYLGGSISPGLRMRAAALHAYSARLPLVEDPGHAPLRVGDSTHTSIASGLYHGIADELLGSIQVHRYQNHGLAVVLTGGDAPRFMGALKNGIFAHPFLTLLGLHEILVHHRAQRFDLGGGASTSDPRSRPAG